MTVWDGIKKAFAVGFKILAGVFMVTVVGATAYWFVDHRQTQRLVARAEQMTEWPASTLPLPEGVAQGKLVTRCKNESLDYRFTLEPVAEKDLPSTLPAWLDEIRENVPASARHMISVPRVGPTSFPSAWKAKQLQSRALLIAARHSVSNFTISLIDKDDFRILTWDVDSFSQDVDDDKQPHRYSAEGHTLCSPPAYLEA